MTDALPQGEGRSSPDPFLEEVHWLKAEAVRRYPTMEARIKRWREIEAAHKGQVVPVPKDLQIRWDMSGGLDSRMSAMTNELRALQLWPVLALLASNRQTMTYDTLGKLVRMPPVGLGGPLGKLMYWCDARGLPPLTILIVQKSSGKPGVGLETVKDLDADREAVFQFDWIGRVPPTEEELAECRG